MKKSFYLLLLITVFGCKEAPLKSIGDTSIAIFDKEQLYFSPELQNDTTLSKTGVQRVNSGRILLKKVTLPVYEKQPNVTVKVTVSSNGDPWDKSGSLFVIPKNADLSILDFDSDKIDISKLKDSFPGIQSFQLDEKTYQPAVELMRFMTPFGVGFFNTHPKGMERKPVYIPKWEDKVVWEQDITHLLPLLEGEVYIGAFIDTWTKEGYNISVTLDFKESKIVQHKKKAQTIIPVINTSRYVGGQKVYDQFDAHPAKVTLNISEDLKNPKLYYITTGHGGYAQGDEFNKKENIISLNGKIIKQFIPWRDDCASFRRFNPSAGVWTQKTEWKGKEIEERIASSDYSRSNWCPGSDVVPEIIDLKTLTKGEHTFEFSIPKSTVSVGDKINYWMVSAYIVSDE